VRIVICDDHRLLLEALSSALSAHGHVVEAATSTPADALRAVRLHDPDVLLMDLGFPDADGLVAAQEVMEEHPRTKVVLLTGSDDREPVRRALALGVAGYIRKDQKLGRILGVLERVGRGEPAFDDVPVNGLARGVAVPRPRQPVDDLTPRELDIAHLLEQGLSTVEIMVCLGVSKSTVRSHVHTILAKLGVHSRVQAVARLAEVNGVAWHVPGRGRRDTG